MFISTSQLFAIWDAIEALSGDTAPGIRMVAETSTAKHMLAFLAATYAYDFRDGLTRMARFKRLCSPERLCFETRNGKTFVTTEWPVGTAPEPHIAVDASFALLLEVGRRGAGKHILPASVDLRRPAPLSTRHLEFFGCTIRFGAQRDRLVLNAVDLDLPLLAHNPELLRMLTPALTSAMDDIATHARHELSHDLLSDRSIEIKEVAYRLGYQDTNSFYRAFRDREKVTPGLWRRLNR